LYLREYIEEEKQGGVPHRDALGGAEGVITLVPDGTIVLHFTQHGVAAVTDRTVAFNLPHAGIVTISNSTIGLYFPKIVVVFIPDGTINIYSSNHGITAIYDLTVVVDGGDKGIACIPDRLGKEHCRRTDNERQYEQNLLHTFFNCKITTFFST
jgi:hypothetical protein